jgi:hypothetical protein
MSLQEGLLHRQGRAMQRRVDPACCSCWRKAANTSPALPLLLPVVVVVVVVAAAAAAAAAAATSLLVCGEDCPVQVTTELLAAAGLA